MPSSSGASHKPVALVHDGQAVPCELGSGAWLTGAPRGAYTTARTVRCDMVFKLASHVQRLASSANLMAEADARASDHMAADTPLFHGDALRPLVVRSMQAAIDALKQQPGVAADCESKLTLLLTWSSDGKPDLWCHAEPLPPRPTPPVKLQVRGLPRVNAKAKDSEWVRQRASLEASRPPGVNEVLLATPGGEVMEGLTSNFFVLAADGAVETADEGVLSGTVRELVLQVCAEQGVPVRLQAPRLADVSSWRGAFITSTSRLLLPACEVAYQPCDSASSGSGNGASSTSGNSASSSAGGGELEVRAFASQHPTVQLLEREVLAKVLSCSEPLRLGEPATAQRQQPQ